MEKPARLAEGGFGPDPGGPGVLGAVRASPLAKKSQNKDPGRFFFKLRSILMFPGLNTLPKSQKITKKRISKKVDFQKSIKNDLNLQSNSVQKIGPEDRRLVTCVDILRAGCLNHAQT